MPRRRSSRPRSASSSPNRQNEASPRPRRTGWFGSFRREKEQPERPPLRHWQTVYWPEERRVERGFIVHGKCADGFTSAGLLLHRWPNSLVLYVQPTELLERLERVARNPPREALVIADVAPQHDETQAVVALLSKIRKHCRVTWIDHHAPQWTPELDKALTRAKVETVVDLDRKESGASLVARWADIREPPLLRVADLVRRRDAWVDPTNMAARSWVAVAGARRREYVDLLADVELDGLEEEGRRLVEEKDVRVAHTVKHKVKSHSEAVRWLWGNDDVSDVAERVFTTSPSVVVFLRFGDGGSVSVRSRQGVPVAAELAQRFGGGGHGNAAGFHLHLTGMRGFVYRLLRGRNAIGREVRRTAAELVRAHHNTRQTSGGAKDES